jgi:hypothetical protein
LNMPANASDWETFGKVMAGIEGLRVITGGEVDIVGSLTGVRRDGVRYYYPARRYRYRRPYGRYCYKRYRYPYGYYCYPRRGRGVYYYGPWLDYRIIIRDRDRDRRHHHKGRHHRKRHKHRDRDRRR